MAKDMMARGELVPDDLVYDMVAPAFAPGGCAAGLYSRWVSREPAQAGWLDAFLEHEFFDNSKCGKCLPIVIRMDVDYNQLLLRLTGRVLVPPVDVSITSTLSHPASLTSAMLMVPSWLSATMIVKK